MYVTAVQHGGWRPLFCYESPRATSPPPTTGLGRVFGRGRSSVGGARDRPRWWSVTVRRRISVCHTATPPPPGGAAACGRVVTSFVARTSTATETSGRTLRAQRRDRRLLVFGGRDVSLVGCRR